MPLDPMQNFNEIKLNVSHMNCFSEFKAILFQFDIYHQNVAATGLIKLCPLKIKVMISWMENVFRLRETQVRKEVYLSRK